MKAYFSEYRGARALAIDTGSITLLFLPDNGGRLISLIDRRGREWMASETGETYRGLTLDSVYIDADVCGMDDMFPTIDPETAPFKGGVRNGVLYNDHGEVARSAYGIARPDNDQLDMHFTSSRLLYRFSKNVTATEDGGALIHYEIENLSAEPFPCLFAAHCMLAHAPGGEVILPFAEGEPVEMCFDEEGEYGVRGDVLPLKKEMLVARETDGKPAGNAYKFYFKNKTKTGSIRYRVGDYELALEYDAEKLPYVGIWMNNGKFKNHPCVTPEPCSLPFDKVTEAGKRGLEAVIPPHGSFEFDLKLSVEAVGTR